MREGHPTRLVIERFTVDDLPEGDHEEVARHLDDCSDCRAQVAELGRAREEFAGTHTFDAVGARRVMRHRRHWIPVGLGVVAAAALLLVFVRPVEQVRFKGSGIVLHRKRGDEVRVLTAGDRVRAGDALRVVVTLPRAARVQARFEDAKGRVDRLLDAPLELSPGEHALPGSAVVEAPCVDGAVVVDVSGTELRLEVKCE